MTKPLLSKWTQCYMQQVRTVPSWALMHNAIHVGLPPSLMPFCLHSWKPFPLIHFSKLHFSDVTSTQPTDLDKKSMLWKRNLCVFSWILKLGQHVGPSVRMSERPRFLSRKVEFYQSCSRLCAINITDTCLQQAVGSCHNKILSIKVYTYMYFILHLLFDLLHIASSHECTFTNVERMDNCMHSSYDNKVTQSKTSSLLKCSSISHT